MDSKKDSSKAEAKKLTLKYKELIKLCEKGQVLTINTRLGYAMIYPKDEPFHMRRVFRMVDSEFEEIPFSEIVDKVADYVVRKMQIKDWKMFMEDVLSMEEPTALMEMGELVGKKPKVKPKKGCFSLELRKKHKRVDIWLRDP